jgi:signal transduction histidine kinase
MYLGNNDSALYWLRKSYNTRKNLMKDTVLAAESRLLMAKVLREKGELDASLAEGKHVLAVLHSPDFNKHPDHIELREEFVGVYPGIGITYTELKQWDSATHYFAQGEKLFLESKNETRLPGLYAGWAEMYFAKGVPDSVLYYIKKGEAYETISPITKLRLLELYANYYQLTGNMEKSYMYRMNYYRMADSLQASGNKEQMLMAGSRVQQLLNTSRIDRQNIELAQKDMVALERERERVSLFIIAGALLLVVLVAALSVFQLRKKNKLIGRYNRALESANATKEQFLSVISHDLRGPFNTLIGMSNVLVSNVREKNYAQVSDNAELINESSRKAYVLLDNLMQWVSLQKEGIQVSRAEIPMNELIDEVLRLFRGQALAQSITIAKDIRLGRAFTDKNLLQVILRNLISNAIRHIPVGGRVQLTITHEGHDVHIVVEDNGDGFTDEALEGLFPQEADGTSIARKGGGLGLILVGQFVRQLGGTITAANAPSGGARFTIILADAALPDGEEPGLQSSSTHSYLALTDEDKQALAPLIAQVQDYEIFDTTELRALLEKNGVPETSSIIEWRRQMLQAVYHADETKLRRLIESATS